MRLRRRPQKSLRVAHAAADGRNDHFQGKPGTRQPEPTVRPANPAAPARPESKPAARCPTGEPGSPVEWQPI